MTLPRPLRLLLTLLVLSYANPAAASSCTFSSSGGTLVDFGNYIALGGNLDRQGNIQLNCAVTGLDLLVGYTIKVSGGLSNTALDRRLYFGGSSLRYNLFTDAARTQVLGDGMGGTSTVSGTCVALCPAVPVYGRLYAGQSGVAGPYSDTISVEVNF